MTRGRIRASFGRQYEVEADGPGRVLCYPKGKRSHFACGDEVEFTRTGDDQGVIQRVVDRRNLLYRSDAWKEKLIAANVSQVVLVTATEPGFSDELLADNLLGFILAGHETTAVALTWTLYLVSAHAPTRERLRAEAEAVIGDSDVSPAHLPRLGFARQVVSEALRLYPPAFLLTRISARDTEICGHRVRAGERVNIPVYAIHRRPSVWSNPHVFDPDRFSAQGRQPGRFEYMPFGGGPRICIGAALAMAEAVTVIVTLLRAADFTPPSPDRVWPQTGLALYPRHGMSMTVRFRPR